ncbi:MAG: DUF2167 domain-containing protein [Hyphomonadaceae bacterium]|nr:DUF2167 domain-containing protein [Hyphomonadaceae bacterium]
MRLIRTTLAVAALAAFSSPILMAPALADGPAAAPRYTSPAAAEPAVAPSPSQAPVRAGPIQPTAETASAAPRTGQIALANGAAQLNVPAGYLFYGPAEAQAYLQRTSAAAPRGEVLGLLAPAGTRPESADFWGSVITYEPVGRVMPEGAALLTSAEMAANTRAARQEAGRGFEGFVAQPAFEPGAASLAWAERTAPDAPAAKNLRHEQRLLGRYGALSFVTIGRFDQFDQIRTSAPTMLQMASFPSGQGYNDFNASTDQTSRFDLAGLVTGKESATAQAASEAGGATPTSQGFAGSGAGIQGYFPWIAGGVVALAALGWLLLGRKKPKPDDEDEAPAQA